MPATRILGVDPGLTGGLALLIHDENLILDRLDPMPIIVETVAGRPRGKVCAATLARIIADMRPAMIALETGGPWPGPG